VIGAGMPVKLRTEDCSGPASGIPTRCATPSAATWITWAPHLKRVAAILGHEGTRTTETVYIRGQEVIDMTADEFETYGSQFGNQPAEGVGAS
jgi:hypothetical protein